MDDFLEHVFGIVDQSIDNYLERKFDHLMISFGCTGGKHRSVYSAEKLQAHLKQKYGNKLSIRLTHHQLKNDNLLP
jgi:RNase adaptor protein for sRNA GlmZ degradation